MRKILLVIDDFNDLNLLENTFRSLGFEVLSLSQEHLVDESLRGFLPDLVIATAQGPIVDGVGLAARLSQRRSPPKTILVHLAGQESTLNVENSSLIAARLESPIQALQAIRTISGVIGEPEEALVEKYLKLVDQKNQPGGQASQSAQGARTSVIWDPIRTPGRAATARSERSDRYEKFLAEQDDPKAFGALPKELGQGAAGKQKKESAVEKVAGEKLNEQKRDFVKALFRPPGADDGDGSTDNES
jgi:CheY-like chemotaxis protein